ncbi:FtsX-like permease family protein [Candidatus Peregrinibacteria bacterium]|nr:FtsX-like permease family protein [Candidatus Peregrinibacteria bacterium]
MKAKIDKTGIKGNAFVSLFRGIKLGFLNFWRNKYLSFATVIVMAVIIVIFNIILAVQFIGNQALSDLSERVDIILYLKDDISIYNAQKFVDELSQVQGVSKVKYTSKEEALQIVAETHPETAEFLKKFDLKNPLPPSISIATNNAEDHDNIVAYLNTSQFKSLMENYVANDSPGENKIISSVAENLKNISQFVKQIIFWIIFVFIIGGTLIVANAISLTIFNRKQEIHIMRLVGATPSFIRLPFVLEAILYGTFAVILSFIILYVISTTISLEGTNLWNYYSELNLWRVFLSEMTIAVVLAGISSSAATEQHIQGKLTLN